MSRFKNSKVQKTITTVLLCITAAMGLVFAILGAPRAVVFLREVTDFVWDRFKGFLVGCLIVFPIWLLWWLISSIIDKVSLNRAIRDREKRRIPQAEGSPIVIIKKPGVRPICPSCGIEVADTGRFCRCCGWDFTRPAEEAEAEREAWGEQAEQEAQKATAEFVPFEDGKDQ